MKKFMIRLMACTILAAPFAAQAETAPVTKVILSTAGLAHVEHVAHVTGNSTLDFPVRLRQVDDILKSLVVFDAKGTLGGVTLPGQQPLLQIFKDLPFTQAHLAHPMLLLNAYQGAAVTIETGGKAIAGKLLQVAAEQIISEKGDSQTRHRIGVMTPDGLKQAILEDASALRFDEEDIRADIARALAAIRENGKTDQRTLTVSLQGEAARKVTLSYVVDAPLWKAAYRMVLPEDGKEKGLLQGWAVVENMTAADWKDVDLTLVSGNPVTFRQSLYQSYYVTRPEIPVEVFGRVMPRRDDGAVALEETASNESYEQRLEQKKMGRLQRGPAMMPMAAAPAMADSMGMAYAEESVASGGLAYNALSDLSQSANAAQSTEATTQVLFRFPSRFTLKAGNSMMLPFVSQEIPMKRVALYQPETHARHPLAAAEISNTADSGLPPGILTLYEESALLKGTAFVGDAQLPVLAAGEDRLVSYALDTKTTIDRTDKSETVEDKILIAEGVIRTAVKSRLETTYAIKAPEKEPRAVVIEHPLQHDYTLSSPEQKAVEKTATHYRLRLDVKAGETKTLPVVLERTYWQTYGIASLGLDQIEAYARSNGKLSPSTRKQFEKLAALRRELAKTDAQINGIENEKNQIFSDQERVRENLKSMDGKSDIQQKYLKKLEEQEDRIAALDKQRLHLDSGRRKQEGEIAELISEMTVQ